MMMILGRSRGYPAAVPSRTAGRSIIAHELPIVRTRVLDRAPPVHNCLGCVNPFTIGD